MTCIRTPGEEYTNTDGDTKTLDKRIPRQVSGWFPSGPAFIQTNDASYKGSGTNPDCQNRNGSPFLPTPARLTLPASRRPLRARRDVERLRPSGSPFRISCSVSAAFNRAGMALSRHFSACSRAAAEAVLRTR